jgi:hypothetical protein
MTTIRLFAAVALSLTLVLLTAGPVVAQDADDDATLQLAEPTFRIINLPTTLRLPRFKGNFEMTHRFAGNLRRGSFTDQLESLFGIDAGAVVGLEYRFGVARGLQAAVYRSASQRTIQMYAKYDPIHQNASLPISIAALVSVEGIDNFKEEYSPALGIVVSRTMGDVVALYVAPTWVDNTASLIGDERSTLYAGIGGRLRVRPTVYLVAEVSPRVNGYAPGKPQYGFAIEKRAGGHMFQLNFTNSFGTTFGQIARGGTPEALYLGFNLSRKFF